MLTLFTALLAVTPLAAPVSQRPPERLKACELVEIRSQQARHSRGVFRATRILDLGFEARLAGHSKRERALQLRLYTPDGFLYQVLETEVDRGRLHQHRYQARLPVAGTSIMASGLYGRWRVVPHLDGHGEPCGPGRSFVIEP